MAASLALARAAETDTPDASGWSKAMDALLLHRRGARKLAWRVVAPVNGMNARRCQERYRFLTSGEGRPTARRAEAREPEADRDGLEWLLRKGRLTPSRAQAAQHYRETFRNNDGPSVKSCLNVGVGGGDAAGAVQAAAAGRSTAKRELFVLRFQVLGGQTDMLTVVDGVCGVGHTIRGLIGAGSADHVKERAKILEAVLMIALDLIAVHLDGNKSMAA